MTSPSRLLLVGVFILGSGVPTSAGDLQITELMALNRTVLFDEDGDSPDWVEIHSSAPDPVDLDGWYLTDDAGDLRKWRFPAVTLDSDGYLVVFCSGKNRGDPASELHANFKLTSSGEYLAIVEPDGFTVSHEYSPGYPEQRADFSFGFGQDLLIESLVPDGSPARILVPQDDALGTGWTGGEEPFDDSSWIDGETGVGYLVSQPGFAVSVYMASTGVDSLSTAEQVVENPGLQAQVHAENHALIDYYNTGGTGRYPGDRPFPGTTVGDDVNEFVVEATAIVIIPSAGAWTFGVNSDDGFGLDIQGNGASFRIEHPTPRGPGDTVGVFDVPDAGAYELRLIMYEHGGGAGVELFAAAGSHGSWNTSFALVGDTTAGGLVAESQPVASGTGAGFRTLIRTDVKAEMFEARTSAYVRVPFQVSDPSRYESLALRMKYDDGFVAWLNGVELARRNAPAIVGYDSRATADRPSAQALGYQDIDISSHLELLGAGNNILALHGLNDRPESGDFLVLAELAEITVVSMAEGFFVEPSPGAANGSVFTDFVADTTFSVDRGFYDTPFSVEITTATPGAEIRYTLDGSSPTETTGFVYSEPIPVTGSTTLRAAAYRPGSLPTNVDTQTYIFVDDVLAQTGAGFPATWGSVSADYEMDPEVVESPLYSGRMRDDLLSLPSVSIVMNRDDLFSSGRGIYANSQSSGVAWERPGSVELILPEGVDGPAGNGEGFQVTCAVRMHGGVGRIPSVPKHSFRFLFKGAYGPTKLDYPLFGDAAADRFDTLILRAGFNNSWVFNNSGQMRQAQYLRDQWMRDAGLAMGTPQPHGLFVHLYVNGLYWGLYNFVERPSAPFAASYFGGDKEEWDVLNSGEPVDGSKESWNAMHALAESGLASANAYEAIQEYLDVPNLIDYMIFNFYGGNSDWDSHNWYAGRQRLRGAGFKFFSWDAERSLEGVTGGNRTGLALAGNPSGIYSALRANEEFLALFADRAHRYLFNDGALTPEISEERYRRLAELVDGGIVGESARWGDAHRETPLTHDAEWATERDRLLDSYFPQRTQVVVSQFRSAGLYPSVDAPRFSQHGGRIEPGFGLVATAGEGTIYYTLDGSDPRLPGGALSPTALVAGAVTANTLVPSGADVRVLVPQDDSLGLEWTLPEFDDTGWTGGTTGVGFERSSGYEDLIEMDVDALMGGTTASVYLRIPFEIDEPDAVAVLELRMKYDDGFAAFLNGEPVVARNAPADLAWNSVAAASHDDSQTVIFESFDIPDVTGLLRQGTNVLAIQGLNISTGSSDLLILPELRAIEATGQGIILDDTTTVRSRTARGNEWSALNEAFFHVDVPLRITELMYHPRAPGDESSFADESFEFVELQNIGEQTLDLSGFWLAGGIEYEFSTGVTVLRPREAIVVAKDLDAFIERYPFVGVEVVGPYSGRLGNAGDQLVLEGPLGEPILEFDYSDTWRPESDGEGYSLIIINTSSPPESWGEESSWTLSPDIDGSPGVVEGDPDAGWQRAGDANQDGSTDIADAVSMLRRLFGAGALPNLPCEGPLDAVGNLAVFDSNGDASFDLSDAVHLLSYIFAAGPGPAGGERCLRVEGCAAVCIP